MRRALEGESAAFTCLITRHKAWLFRLIRRYVGNNDEAFDLLQESMVAAWSALHRFDPARSFPAWLRQIALNKCRDWSRRSFVRRIVRHLSGELELFAADARESNPEISLLTEQALGRLDKAIASLPLALREPLILTVFEGLSHRDAAEQLGVSEKAIETRIYRARQKLQRVIEKTDLTALIKDTTP